MTMIKPSSDRKTRDYQNQMNTFGIMPGKPEDGGTCPGCTTGKGGCWAQLPGRITHTCYVDGLLRIYKGVRAVLEHNTALLRGASVEEMTAVLDAEFSRFEAAEQKRANATGGAAGTNYRLHWSGDVFSVDYAKALVAAMRMHPKTAFWTYTRSFTKDCNVVAELLKAENLMLYLSLDPSNTLEGLLTYVDNGGDTNPRLQICYMSPMSDFAAQAATADSAFDQLNEIRRMVGRPLAPKSWGAHVAQRMTACPVDNKALPLERGCLTCRKCVAVGGGPIWFKA